MANLPFDICEYTEAIAKVTEFMTRTSCDRFHEGLPIGDLSKAAGAKALHPYLNPWQNSEENMMHLREFAKNNDIHMGLYQFTFLEHSDDGTKEVTMRCHSHDFPWDNQIVSCEIIQRR
ncbi:MAG: hypothetical protein ACO3NK_17430 [Prochlorotrichaceae cyanobacterium]|jgi:hypothetical protein